MKKLVLITLLILFTPPASLCAEDLSDKHQQQENATQCEAFQECPIFFEFISESGLVLINRKEISAIEVAEYWQSTSIIGGVFSTKYVFRIKISVRERSYVSNLYFEKQEDAQKEMILFSQKHGILE